MITPAKRSPRMTVEECWAYVTDAHTGILTTLRRDGMPIALPLWFAVVDGAIYFQTRGKKLARLRNDPRAGFLVEDGEHWKDLRSVHFTGRAELVDLDADLAGRFGAELDRKYAGFRSRSEMPAETAQYYATSMRGVVRFTPEDRILNWDNAKLMS